MFVFTVAVFETQIWSPEKTLNFVMFLEFLTHPLVHHTLREISTRGSTSKSGTGKDYLSCYWRSPTKSTFKCLFKQTPLLCIIISKCLRIPEDQDDREKGTLSNQPQLTHVTPTALLGSWVLQPIKDVMSLRIDFETHAKWQGYVEEPAAKDFVAREVCTIKLNKVQGTHWNVNKCVCVCLILRLQGVVF